MRLVVSVMTVLLLVGVLGFVATNYETRVGVTVFETRHDDVPLYAVVVLAIVAGIVYAGLIAVAEGAAIRFQNRRLAKDVERLERELAFARTQPAASARPEPDAIVDRERGDTTRDAGDAPPPPSSAPVYEADGDDWEPDPGEDAYSGGRAV